MNGPEATSEADAARAARHAEIIVNAVECRTCRRGDLVRKHVTRFGTMPVVIGCLLALLGVVGAIVGVVLLVNSGIRGLPGALILILAAFIAIGMGSLLAHRKQILQCTFCRAVIPAL